MTVGKTWDLDMAAGPIYRQIAQHVQRALARGVLAPSDQLPSVRELAQQLKVNQNTVVHAYSQLEREGIIETRRGLGTFIRADIPLQISQRELLAVAAQRYVQEAKALSVSSEEAVKIVREVLDAGDVG